MVVIVTLYLMVMVVRAASPAAWEHQAGDGDTAAALLQLRRSTEHWIRQARERSHRPTGLSSLDGLLAGGWPEGKVSELVGALSSGRSAVAAVTVAEATRRGEVVAWVDMGDTVDPASLVSAGVDLARVLWVRPHGIERAVRAVELVLEVGGFTVAVLDLTASVERRALSAERGAGNKSRTTNYRVGAGPGGGTVPGPRGGRRALRLRLVRAAEKARAVVIVLAEQLWVGAHAAVTVTLERGTPSWGGQGRGAPAWLAGILARARLERGGLAEIGSHTQVLLSWYDSAVTQLHGSNSGHGPRERHGPLTPTRSLEGRGRLRPPALAHHRESSSDGGTRMLPAIDAPSSPRPEAAG